MNLFVDLGELCSRVHAIEEERAEADRRELEGFAQHLVTTLHVRY